MQISSGTYLLRVDRELFHCAGRWSSSLYLGQVKSAAVDLIVPGFMAVLMVHLALTRLDGGTLSRVYAHVRQYGNILLKTGRRKRERKIERFDRAYMRYIYSIFIVQELLNNDSN